MRHKGTEGRDSLLHRSPFKPAAIIHDSPSLPFANGSVPATIFPAPLTNLREFTPVAGQQPPPPHENVGWNVY